MKTKAMFSVIGVHPDGGPVLVVKQSTLHGAELVRRLIQNASPFSEVHIEYGLDSEMSSGQSIVVNESSR
jgi:hypothetical protein